MKGRTLREWINARARSSPRKLAIAPSSGAGLSYGELDAAASATAAALQARGITPADRVGVACAQGTSLAIGVMGVASCCTCVPLTPDATREQIEAELAHTRPAAVLVDASRTGAGECCRRFGIPIIPSSEIKPTGRELDLPAPLPTDVAILLQTAGTTARSKLVPLTHGNLLTSAENLARSVGLTPEDRCLAFLPMHHAQGILSGLLSTLVSGGTVRIEAQLKVPEFFDWLKEFHPTWYTATPTMHRMIADHAPELLAAGSIRSLRCIRSGGAPLPVELIGRLESLLKVPLIEAYGMTEAGTPIATNPMPPEPRKPGTVGRPFGCEVRISDSEGRPLPANSEGEILLRGATVFGGYADDPETNGLAFHGDWFRTGDLGRLDEDRYLTITGRLKELINRGGEKISPATVEMAIRSHPDVQEVVVFPIPHATLGEEVAAAVVARNGSRPTAEAIREHVSGRLREGEVPRKVILVRTIPRGSTGKVQRNMIFEQLDWNRPAGEAHVPSPGGVEETLIDIWRRVLKNTELGAADDFFDSGGNSLSALRLLSLVNRELGVQLQPPQLFQAPTPGALASMVARRIAEPRDVIRLIPGNGTPFFWVHAGEGDTLMYRTLSRACGLDIPFYGLQARSLEEEDPEGRITGFAKRFLQAILEIQPDGPYRLGGFCSGGLIAYEIASRLVEMGRRVSILALLDPSKPRMAPVHRVRFGALKSFHAGIGEAAVSATILTVQSVLEAVRWVVRLARSGFSQRERRRLRTWLIQARAIRRYRPGPYPGDVVILDASPSRLAPWKRSRWRRLISGRLEFGVLHGGHFSPFSALNAVRNARALRRHLKQCDLPSLEHPEGLR